MKIALINENIHADKNSILHRALDDAVRPLGHTVDNYGMCGSDDTQLTYAHCAVLGAILLGSGAADYVVTGCTSGEAIMVALNSFPCVICGHIVDEVDAVSFSHIAAGNAAALPLGVGYGWCGAQELAHIFEGLFYCDLHDTAEPTCGMPMPIDQARLKMIRSKTFQPFTKILPELDVSLVKTAVGGPRFQQLFFPNCKISEISDYISTLL